MGPEGEKGRFLWDRVYQQLQYDGTNMAGRRDIFYVIQSCSVRQFEICSHDRRAICFLLISPINVQKALNAPPRPLHHNVDIIFMNERARWSVISLHPLSPSIEISSLMKREGNGICGTLQTGCTIQIGPSDYGV